MPSLLWQLHHSDDGSNLDLPVSREAPSSSKPRAMPENDNPSTRAREDHGGNDPLRAAAPPRSRPAAPLPSSSSRRTRRVITRAEDLPGVEAGLAAFLAEHPSFESTAAVDETRESEYPHLRAANRACFDYCGFGLFSFTQRFTVGSRRSGFSLVSAATSGSLLAQAAFSSTEPDTLQAELRSKVLQYLNVSDGYSAVFTASKRAAFQLVAECYDFRARSKLVTVYDHESESVKTLATSARKAGAKVCAARFRWPTLRLSGEQLAAELKTRGTGARLLKKRNGGSGTSGTARRRGLFVFPTQSRITGTKYSYQWMTMAEKHRWDVLLDVSAMGPRDMGSLGLSLFRPDFIVCSFYKVFGSDPTGFGCLLIKDSSMASLRASSASAAIGMVRVVPDLADEEEEEVGAGDSFGAAAAAAVKSDLIAFSGPVMDEVPPGVGSGFPFGSAEVEDDDESDDPREEHGNGNGGTNDLQLGKNNNGFGSGGECSSEIQEVTDHAGSSSAISISADEPSCSYLQEQRDELRALPNGDSDSIYRKIGRDDGLIDSRRSDLFPRFLPIREEEEEDLPDQSAAELRSATNASANLNNSSRRSFNTSGRSWRRNSSSWDGEGDYYDDDIGSDEGWDEDEDEDLQRERQQQRVDPLIVCAGLDHARTMGLNRTNCRIKNLMDWLIASMSSLFHHIPDDHSGSTSTKRWRRRPLVQIFGPKAQIDRGPAIAFNLYDQRGALIQPATVQKLADRSSISLACGCLSNLFLEEVTVGSGSDKENTAGSTRKKTRLPEKCSSMAGFLDHSGSGASKKSMKKLSDLPVLTATLGLVSNFEDVYRLWEFAARFLEPEFVEGEILRYQSLDQTVVTDGERAASTSTV